MESSTGACRYGTSRASAPPSVEDNARLDAAADRAVALPRRLITMLDMSAHRRTRRLAASTAADYRMFKNAENVRSPLPDRSRSPCRGRHGRALVVRRRELQRRRSVAGAADDARRRRDRRGRGRVRRRRCRGRRSPHRRRTICRRPAPGSTRFRRRRASSSGQHTREPGRSPWPLGPADRTSGCGAAWATG